MQQESKREGPRETGQKHEVPWLWKQVWLSACWLAALVCIFSLLLPVLPANCCLLGTLPLEGKPVAFRAKSANQMFSILLFQCFKTMHLELGIEWE